MRSPLPAEGHYHLHVHTISRLKGHRIQAAVAYRRAERIIAGPVQSSVLSAAAYRRAQALGNDGEVFDYRRKIGVAWTGMLAPAFTPKELLDPQTLWNTVERIEHRANARLAREMIIALPHQVDLGVHVAMLRAFVNTQLVSRGMVADIAIHRPPVEHGGDPRNWHAHVLLTDRPMTPTGFALTKDRTWNKRENVKLWRQAWADVHNTTMESLSLPYRIDHRSLEEQRAEALARGDVIAALHLDREPQIHVGREVHVNRRTKTLNDRARRNQSILQRNRGRAFARYDALQSAIARADSAAHREARQLAEARDTWHDLQPSYAELQATYGRDTPTTPLGRLRESIRQQRAADAAMALSRRHGHPWQPDGDRPNAPSILDTLLAMVPDSPPRRSVFSVTPKDIAFALYKFGFTNLRELRAALHHIDIEEQRTQPKRRPRKHPLPVRRTPPSFPTPQADQLRRLQHEIIAPRHIYSYRLAQLAAFNQRHGQTRRSSQVQRVSQIVRRFETVD